MLPFEHRGRWVTPSITAIVAFAVPLILSFLPSFDVWQFAYLLFVLPVTLLLWLIVAFFRRSSVVWVSLVVFCAVTAICWRADDYFFRVHGRWLYLAASSKNQVLVQQAPTDGQLRHLDWDGWGMFAQDTEVYLVNDAVNASMAIDRTLGGLQAKGVPCKFWRAYRLEPHWYAIVFFTETSWESCS